MTKRTFIRVTMRKWDENFGRYEGQTLTSLLEHLRYSGIVQYDWGKKEEPLLIQWEYPFPDKKFATTHVKPRIESFGDRVEVIESEDGWPFLYRRDSERVAEEGD
jgi:hypothetical protein